MAELQKLLENAGFTGIAIQDKDNSDEIIKNWKFGEGVEKMVFSAYIQARKRLLAYSCHRIFFAPALSSILPAISRVFRILSSTGCP